ncbi:MAG: anti-virulence regulator CigR family protein [Pseudomonadota bacterium]
MEAEIGMIERKHSGAIVGVSALVLLLAAGQVPAQPTDNPGRGQGAAKGKEMRQAPGQQKQSPEARQRGERSEGVIRDRDYWRDRERRRDDTFRDGPSIDERELRRIFDERRGWVSEGERDSLPPGIRMNLERGKPLPPGIAKRFDDRALRHLPRYEGYEWRRAGADAILVDAADEIIYRVIRDVLN